MNSIEIVSKTAYLKKLEVFYKLNGEIFQATITARKCNNLGYWYGDDNECYFVPQKGCEDMPFDEFDGVDESSIIEWLEDNDKAIIELLDCVESKEIEHYFNLQFA